MGALATAPGVLGAAMTTYITVVDVMTLLGCKENKAYETIRAINSLMDRARRASIFFLRNTESLWMWSMQ